VTAETSTVYRGAGRPARPVLRRLPGPRLTGLGGGLFATVAMFALGCLDRALFGSSPVVYGALFLPVCALTALWVRTADLVTAPISAPLAFACGLLPIAGGSDGVGSRLMAVVTALAVHAGWLYGGTLVAGLIVGVRKVRQRAGRQAAARAEAADAPVAPAAVRPQTPGVRKSAGVRQQRSGTD
jgi:TRAP-type C4-dicarboxylate transport system permease small subunit